jgi:hypothetical protein
MSPLWKKRKKFYLYNNYCLIIAGIKMKNIYELTLHESIDIEFKTPEGVIVWYRILRVAGGWIYLLWDVLHEVYSSPVFVPFNTEYK